MHRVDGPGATVDNLWTEGNPFVAQDGTVATADIYNALQEEIATFIEGEGIVLDKLDNTQLAQALVAFLDRLGANRWPFTAGTDLSAGDPLMISDVFGVVEEDVLTGFAGVLLTGGRHSLPKTSGSSVTEGDATWWDPGAGQLRFSASAGRYLIGAAAETVGVGPTAVIVRLNGTTHPAET